MKFPIVVILLWLSFLAREVKLEDDSNPYNKCRELRIEILVSAKGYSRQIRELELQWEYAPQQPGDWIALFGMDPAANTTFLPPVLWRGTVDRESDWIKTTVLEQHVEPASFGYRARCLGYFAAYLDASNQILAATCLRSEPTWMWDLRPIIGKKKIAELFIPGTHDSAAYRKYTGALLENVVDAYSITQDESVLGQLIHGVRYLDLRIGYYPSDPNSWYANHGVIWLHRLRPILEDIKEFLDNTQEIVILDIQEFPVGFDNEGVHKMLGKYLESILGKYCVPQPFLGYRSTLNDVWETGKRLIIGYDEIATAHAFDCLWFPVEQRWGNFQNLKNLRDYIAESIRQSPGGAWAAMAELTPTTHDILFSTWGFSRLRDAAEHVNHFLTQWYHSQDWCSRSNFVAVDFVRSSGIVRAAIDWHKYQGRCNTTKKP